jgi:hypothetical protein
MQLAVEIQCADRGSSTSVRATCPQNGIYAYTIHLSDGLEIIFNGACAKGMKTVNEGKLFVRARLAMSLAQIV